MSNIRNFKSTDKVNATLAKAATQLTEVGAQYRKLLVAFDAFQRFLIKTGAPVFDEAGHDWWLEQSDYELGLAVYRNTAPFHEVIGVANSGLGELLSALPALTVDDDSIPF